MGDTHTGKCIICDEETDLIDGKCEDCASRTLDYQIAFLGGRRRQIELDKAALKKEGK